MNQSGSWNMVASDSDLDFKNDVCYVVSSEEKLEAAKEFTKLMEDYLINLYKV